MDPEKATPQPDDVSPRRKDLVELGEAFKEALKPVGSLVSSMQKQNTNSIELLDRMSMQAQRTDRLQRWVFINTAVALLAMVILIVVTLSVRQVVRKVDMTAGHLESVAATVSSAKRSADEVKAEVAQVSSAQANQPRMELVPETDSERAMGTPVRVRIVAPTPTPSVSPTDSGTPRRASQPPPARSVEFVIPRENFEGEPAKP